MSPRLLKDLPPASDRHAEGEQYKLRSHRSQIEQIYSPLNLVILREAEDLLSSFSNRYASMKQLQEASHPYLLDRHRSRIFHVRATLTHLLVDSPHLFFNLLIVLVSLQLTPRVIRAIQLAIDGTQSKVRKRVRWVNSHNLLEYRRCGDKVTLLCLYMSKPDLCLKKVWIDRECLLIERCSGRKITSLARYISQCGRRPGIAGVLLMAQQNSYTPAIGTSFFLPPYVAAFFGMSVLGAHRFTVFGTVIGGLFIATFQQGLLIMAAPTFLAELIEGLVLLVILTIIIRADRTAR